MLGLIQGLLTLVVLISRDELLIVKVLLALEVNLSLFQVNLCQSYTHLCRRELAHIRNHLHLGDHLSLLHILSWFLQQFSDDTRDLRFHVHLVARLDLTCDDRCLLDILHLRRKLVVDNFLGLAFLPEEHECSDENQSDNGCDNQFAVLFHNYIVFTFLPSYFFIFTHRA